MKDKNIKKKISEVRWELDYCSLITYATLSLQTADIGSHR